MSNLPSIKGLMQVSGSTSPTLASAVYDLDCAGGNTLDATLMGKTTVRVRNLKPGHFAVLSFTQDATGGRTVTFAASAGASYATVGPSDMLAVDPTPGATTVLILTGVDQACTRATVAARVPNVPGRGDEVLLSPTGSDDTANVKAALDAQLVPVLGPPGAVFYLDGRVLAFTVTIKGVRLMERVEVRPVAGWAPAIGSVADPTNTFFQVRGQAGSYSSTSASVQRRGSRKIVGVASTVGLSAGMWVEMKASPTGGRSLPEDRELVQVESVTANVITTRNPLRLNYGDGKNTLPVVLTSVTPVENFFIECGEGAFFNTQDRNIAGIVYLERCIAAWGSAAAVTAGTSRQLRFDGLAGVGFTLAFVNQFNVAGTIIAHPFSMGSNNGLLFQQCSHATEVFGFRSSSTAPYVNANGWTRCMIWSEAGGSDNYFHDCDFTNVAGGIHPVGGYANRVRDNKSFGLLPDIRFSRDPGQVGLYLGALIDWFVNPGTNEGSYEPDIGDNFCAETYVDAVTRPIAADRGVHSFVFVDVYGLSVSGCLHTANVGNGTQALDGQNVDPCGGVMLFDCFYGSRIEAIRGRNVAGSVCTNVAGFGGTIGCVTHEIIPGIAADTPSYDAVLLGGTGTNSSPLIEKLYLPNGGNCLQYNATFAGSPDYAFAVGEIINQSSGTRHRSVCLALNGGTISYFACDVCALDPTSAAGTRRVVEAGPDAASPAIIAQQTNTGFVFVALGGGSVLTTGAVDPTSLLTTEGGVNHRAKVNAAATLSTLLGRPMLAKGAGNAVVECRRI